MLYAITAKIADPIEKAKTTFAIWACYARMADSYVEIALLRPDLHKRLLRAREARKAALEAIALRDRLAQLAVDGQVNVIVAGMDCDCVQYSHVRKFPADFDQYCAEVESSYEWADGPMNIYLVTAEEAANHVDYSRDLALEAYEDGHPHVVYMS